MSTAAAVDLSAPAFAPEAILDKAGSENFPVALRLLPRQLRSDLLAIYGYARLVDDLGDRAEGDRLALLDWVEGELDRALEGQSDHPILAAAGEMAHRRGIGRGPFADLIAANRLDQVITRYQRYEDLVGYCALSANPVGRLVLAVFGISEARAAADSDRICTALQIIEHVQDLVEDHEVGRIYLPLDDLADFGVCEDALRAEAASPALRRLIAFECGRARDLLVAGSGLVARSGGPARLALAGFAGGGFAQLDAIAAAGYDVIARRPKASVPMVARRALALLLARKEPK
ncbi:MAG: squalene synthase HpnC [Actinomycetota bacterium]|nr:squalene synthase HpnC [Actinomycetota bacterium]